MKNAEDTTWDDLSDESKKIWLKLENVPCNDYGEIEESFLQFSIGTDREEIWLWFENKFNTIVGNIL